MKKAGLSNKEIAHICRGLSVFLHAGIPQGEGMLLLAEEEQGEIKNILLKLGKMADEGLSLSQSLDKLDCFPVYASGLIRVGEHTGHLEEAIKALEEYYEGQARLTRQLKNTLTYPVVLLFLMLAVIGVLLIKVLPVFEEMYGALGASVTGVAKGLFAAGEMLTLLLPVLCVLLMLLLLFVFLFLENKCFRERILTWCRRKFGNYGIAKKMNDAHFAQALTMGLKSGMFIEDAIALAGVLLKDNPDAVFKCKQCEERIREGKSLKDALTETAVLPASACRMLEIGIRGGNGDEVMAGITERLMEDAEAAAMEMVSKIEPVMVIVTSVLVGMILLSVMIPLLNIMSAIG